MSNNNSPIAIVGIGCRFPGASSTPEKFWKMMVDQTDAIIDVPSDRWDNKRFYDEDERKIGKLRTKQGGFLQEKIKDFDPMFFGISPIEAECLDPQERILLEVAYEAFEDAGIPIDKVKGSDTGVYIGGFTLDNYLVQTAKDNRHLIDSHTATGLSMTMLSNKLSYFFDLSGPSVTMDTACSSSLVAMHYACESIRRGETSMALVGGVNALIKPEVSLFMSKGQFLSKHSRCKTFDADAGGYVRGEGGGVVIIKPYEVALADGDRIYALINGTGVNQDGHTNGITVPSRDAQKKLIRTVYEESGIDESAIHYVEAHGTGTPVGDPIEFGVLNDMLSRRNEQESKCLVGSVKTNIGHLEAASGVAGLIKTALCLTNNSVPPNLHFNQPNPALNYEQSSLRVPTSVEKLPEDQVSYASINSFGYGGTNAHAVLKQVPTDAETPIFGLEKEDQFIFPISARSEEALKELAGKYSTFVENSEADFSQILSNAIYRRSQHSDRLAIVASSRDELVEKLEAFEEDILVKGVTRGNATTEQPKLVFVYTGMGPQWWKMGRELMETEPVFKAVVQECDVEFKKISGWSVLDEMQKPEEASNIKETYIAQPANLVIQIALTRLLEHYGITPDAVVGHSVGEVASTYISGALTLQEALLVSYHRSRLQHLTSGTGTMLAVGVSEADVIDELKAYEDVSVAAINSPDSVTLSGTAESLEKLAARFERKGIFNRMLDVSVPYHSPMMAPIKEELFETLEVLDGKATTIDLYSTVTGEQISGEEIDNEYWWRNVREPVRFAKAMETIANDKYTVFIEVGPHPVLKNSMKECLKNNDAFSFLETINRKTTEQLNFFENIASLFTLGFELNWEKWVAKYPHLPMPSYPWQKEYYWRESKNSTEDRVGRTDSLFLNQKIDAPQTTYKVELNKYFFPYLSDHIVQDNVVFPGAGYIAAGLEFYQHEFDEKLPIALENIKFHQMLVIQDDQVQDLYTSHDAKNGTFSVDSRTVSTGDDLAWTKRATGKFIVGDFNNRPANIDIKAIAAGMTSKMSEEAVYKRLSKSKLDYGPYFRTVKHVDFTENELVATIKGHDSIKGSSKDFVIHPTLLDACFQLAILFDDSEFVPVSIGKMYCYATPGDEFFCYARLTSATDNAVFIDMQICDSDGNVALELKDYKCQQLVTEKPEVSEFIDNCLFESSWVEETVTSESVENTVDTTYIFTDDYAGVQPLSNQLTGKVVILHPGNSFKELGERHYTLNLENLDDISEEMKSDFQSEVRFVYFLKDQEATDISEMEEGCLDRIKSFLNLSQFCSTNLENKLTLNLITKGSQVVDNKDEIGSIADTVAHGIGRIIVNEFPAWQVRLIDFERPNGSPIEGEAWNLALNKMYASTKNYEELAIRGQRIYRKSMQKWLNDDLGMSLEKVDFQSESLSLSDSTIGIEELKFERVERVEPKPGEVEILVENSTLTYNDYLKVTNKITPDATEGSYLENAVGYACSGVISRLGSETGSFNVGDRVIAVAKGTVRSYLTTSELLTVKSSDLNSAGIHSYLTAIYSLRDKANLSKHDKVLIHNATDGLGLAAIHYAKMVGADVYATAESEEKRSYLESIGVPHIYSCESLDFAREILEETEGKGVDVILSALSKEMMNQSLSILAPYGTYLDIGNKDIIDNASLGMRHFHKNISYVAINLDKMTRDKPRIISRLLHDLAGEGFKGRLTSLPTQVFSPQDIKEAFNAIDEGSHTGEILIDFKDQSIEIPKEEQLIKPDQTYLITGGTNGLGLEIGKWLVDKGARHLALLSRSGLKSEHTIQVVQEMKDQDVNVHVFAADVADLDQITGVFAEIEANLPPLSGVFHCAMVLDDGYLTDMNEERFRKVLRPKVVGAINLHQLTKGLELDHFVLFSSISSLIGNVGQSNYVVANALLDSFANIRKNEGLPATTINLGVLAEAGVVSRSENLEMLLEGVGIRSFTNEQVLMGLERILKEKPTQVGFFDLNWEALSNGLKGSGLAVFQDLINHHVGTENDGLSKEQSAYLDQFSSMNRAEQKEYVVAFLVQELSKILKIPKDKIRLDKGIGFLGIDSILSVELLRIINDKFALKMTSMELLSLPSVNQLSETIIDKIEDLVHTELV